MIDSYGSPVAQFIARFPGFRQVVEPVVDDSLQRFATLDVRLTGLFEDMHPGGFPGFLRGKMMALFYIWGDFPVEKLKMEMSWP